MQKSDSIAALAASLSKAQGFIRGAVKDSANPFFKSKYADLASVVEAIRCAFSENGLAYTQIIAPSDKEEVCVETVILHESGEWLSCGVLSLPVSKADAQGYGSALAPPLAWRQRTMTVTPRLARSRLNRPWTALNIS